MSLNLLRPFPNNLGEKKNACPDCLIELGEEQVTPRTNNSLKTIHCFKDVMGMAICLKAISPGDCPTTLYINTINYNFQNCIPWKSKAISRIFQYLGADCLLNPSSATAVHFCPSREFWPFSMFHKASHTKH